MDLQLNEQKALVTGTENSLNDLKEEFFTEKRPTSLIQRFADVEDVAHWVAQVTNPSSAATNDAALRVDGGVVNSII